MFIDTARRRARTISDGWSRPHVIWHDCEVDMVLKIINECLPLRRADTHGAKCTGHSEKGLENEIHVLDETIEHHADLSFVC